MGVMLDIFFAFIVGTMALTSMAAMNEELVTAQHRNALQYAVQSHSADLQRLLLRDLRMAGAGVASGVGVVQADSTALELRGDFLRDGAQHTLRYTLGDAAEAAMTENPRDRLLWRRLDGGPPEAFAFGLVGLRFDFLDSAGAACADPAAVRHVRYWYALESPVPYGDPTPALFVAGALTPKNLR